MLQQHLVSLRQQLADPGKIVIADRAVFNRPAMLMRCWRTYSKIAAHRGQVRFAVASQMSRSSSHAHVSDMLAQLRKRFAVAVVQDADELIHDRSCI
jgi:hypothetical protein